MDSELKSALDTVNSVMIELTAAVRYLGCSRAGHPPDIPSARPAHTGVLVEEMAEPLHSEQAVSSNDQPRREGDFPMEGTEEPSPPETELLPRNWRTSSRGPFTTSRGSTRGTRRTTGSGRQLPCGGDNTTGERTRLWEYAQWTFLDRMNLLHNRESKSTGTWSRISLC